MLRGVAFRSSRFEPYGDAFLRRAVGCLLVGDVPGMRAAYVETVAALRRRTLPTAQVAARVRLTKAPEEYHKAAGARREHAYEALLASGVTTWRRGEQVRVYRAAGGPAVAPGEDEDDPRTYDAEYYVRLLRETYAERLARAFTADDWAALFGDPAQPSLFDPPVETIRSVLTTLAPPPETEG